MCYKLLVRFYMMVRSDKKLYPLKNKLDHVTLSLERRDKGKMYSPLCHRIGRRWRGSHAQYQETSAHKNHHTALLLHRDSDCKKNSQVFTQEENFSLCMKA